MEIRLLGGPTGGNGSPRLWATNQNSVIVQGWRTNSDERIEIPHQLLGFLEPDTCLATPLHDTGYGTFTLSGSAVTDPAVLATMAIPAHETAIEVPLMKARKPASAVPA